MGKRRRKRVRRRKKKGCLNNIPFRSTDIKIYTPLVLPKVASSSVVPIIGLKLKEWF